MKKVLVILLLTISLISNNAISQGYGFFDTKTDTTNEQLDVGYWEFIALPIGPDFASKLSIYVDDELEQDPDSKLKYIYSQTDVPNNKTAKILEMDVFGYTWKFEGKGKATNYPTMGYPVLIDRAVDEFGNPIHDIAPSYSASPLYPDYNYFTAYDAMNLHTNNQYSLRLNYMEYMSTTTSIGKVSNISFYAMTGLSDSNDAENVRRARFYVYVSNRDGGWTRIGSERSNVVTSESEFFTHYSFDVPANMLGEELYVKIAFYGQTYTAGFARLVIDDLVITTIE
jgi:hypothetical protein